MTEVYNKKSQIEKRRLLRANSTQAEKLLWAILRNSQLGGYKFRRQFGVGLYIVDFYCPAAHLVIELDGAVHLTEEAQINDELRQKDIEVLGLTILRFTNDQVSSDLNFVVSNILSALQKDRPPLQNPLLTKERAG